MLYTDTPEYDDIRRAEKSAMPRDAPPAVMCRDMAVAFRRPFDYDVTLTFAPATTDPSVLHAVLWDGAGSRIASRLVSLDVVMPAGHDPGAVTASTLQVEPLTAFKGQWPMQILSHNPPNAPTHEVPVFGLGGVPVSALKRERMTVLLHCASPDAVSQLMQQKEGGGVSVIARFRVLPPSPTIKIPYFPEMPERKRAFYTGLERADLCYRKFVEIYHYVLGIVYAYPDPYPDTYLLQDHRDIGFPVKL